MRRSFTQAGLSLIELMVALAIASFLMLGTVKLFSGLKSTSALQEGLSRVQEDGRIAVNIVARELRNAGFRQPVWNDPLQGFYPLTAQSVNGSGTGNDALQVMYQDDRNCAGALNAITDPETGEPVMRYKRISFAVDNTDQLTWSCAYGASPTTLAAGFTNEVVIRDVASFQILYGIDTDFPPDFSINGWTNAAAISPQTTICIVSQTLCQVDGLMPAMRDGIPVAVQVALLVRSPDSISGGPVAQSHTVLDVTLPAATDQHIRKLYTTTVTLRNLTL